MASSQEVRKHPVCFAPMVFCCFGFLWMTGCRRICQRALPKTRFWMFALGTFCGWMAVLHSTCKYGQKFTFNHPKPLDPGQRSYPLFNILKFCIKQKDYLVARMPKSCQTSDLIWFFFSEMPSTKTEPFFRRRCRMMKLNWLLGCPIWNDGFRKAVCSISLHLYLWPVSTLS